MKELMIHVERIVRPIRAGGARKFRMREELLAHLQASYDQEIANGLDHVAALDRAKDRLGNPAELNEELQALIPSFERRLATQIPFPIRWMKAVGIVLAVIVPFVVAAAPLPAWLASHYSGSFASIRDVAPPHGRSIFAAAIVALELCTAFFLAFMTSVLPRAGSRRWIRIVGFGILEFAAFLGGIWMFWFSLTNQDLPQGMLSRLGAVQFGFFVEILAIAMFLGKKSRHMEEWRALDISE